MEKPNFSEDRKNKMNRSIIVLAGFLLISAGIFLGVYHLLFEKEAVSRETILEKILQGEEYLRQSSESSKEKAIVIFSELSAKTNPEFHFRIHYNLAQALEKNGDSYRALEIYQSLNNQKNLTIEEQTKVSLALGNLYLKLDRGTEGKAHIEDVLRKSTDRKIRSLSFYALGNYYFHNKNWEEARKNFSLALEEDPHFTDARIGLGRSLKRLGKDYAAFDVFDHYLEESSRMDGTNPKIVSEYKFSVFHQAKDFFIHKNYNKSIEYFQKFLSLQPSPPEEEAALFYIAASFEAQNQFTEAIKYYNKVLNNLHYSLDQEAIFRKGTIYFRQGKFEQAASVLQVAIEKYPKNHITDKATSWRKEAIEQLRDNQEWSAPEQAKPDMFSIKPMDSKKTAEENFNDLELDF